MRSERRARALLAAAALLAAGCDGQPERDAGAVDAGFDAGVDAGRPDAGPRPDAGDGDPRWLRMTGLPDNCTIDVARDPNDVGPPPRWEDCGDGCRRLRADWSPNARGGRLYRGDSFHDGERLLMGYGRPTEAPAGRESAIQVVLREDGDQVLAVRTTYDTGGPSCAPSSLALADGTFAFAVSISTAELRRSYPVRARFDDPIEGWVTPIAERPFIDDFVVTAYTTPTTSVFKAGASERHHRFDHMGVVEELGVGATISSGDIDTDTVLLTQLVGNDWRLVTVPPTGVDPVDLLVPTGAGAFGPRTDGQDLVWLQLYEPETPFRYNRVELWTSPYTTDPMALSPRPLATAPFAFLAPHGVGFGRAWVVEMESPTGPHFVRIYSLTGEPTREWRLPDGRRFPSDPIVGPEEIGFHVGFDPGSRGLASIDFWRYDALPLAP